MRRVLPLLLWLLALAGQARAAEPPGPWGVVVHTPFHAEALKALGVQWVRLGLNWRHGAEDWTASDKLLGYYLDRGFHVIAILGIDEVPPALAQKPPELDAITPAFAAWAGMVARRYAGRGIVWELGNEPETFSLQGLWRVPENYARLARAAAAAMKRADPTARVAALSVAWMDRNYVVRALEAGLLADGTIDAVTYHGYHRPQLLPESGLLEDVSWLQATLARHAPRGKSIEVIDSERGYALAPAAAGKPWGNWRNIVYSEEEQAAFLARHYLEEIAAGVETIVWYKDMFGEDGYSLYYADEHDPRGLRPMGHVYRNLAHLLPESPSRLKNDRYDVTLLNNLNHVSDPNTLLYVRSYLRRLGDHEQLVIALWNPVESAGGQVLDSRRRVGDAFVEKWRPATSADQVVLRVQVQVHELDPARVRQLSRYDLLATTTEHASQPLSFERQGRSIVTARVEVGAIPTVLTLDLR